MVIVVFVTYFPGPTSIPSNNLNLSSTSYSPSFSSFPTIFSSSSFGSFLINFKDYDKMAQRKEIEITIMTCKKYFENSCHHLNSIILVEKWTKTFPYANVGFWSILLLLVFVDQKYLLDIGLTCMSLHMSSNMQSLGTFI